MYVTIVNIVKIFLIGIAIVVVIIIIVIIIMIIITITITTIAIIITSTVICIMAVKNIIFTFQKQSLGGALKYILLK